MLQRDQRMTVIFEWAGELPEQRQPPILVRHQEISVLARPCNRNVRVVPPDPAVVCRRVIIADLVHHHHVILQAEESMGEARRNVKLASTFGGKFCRNMLTVGGRSTSDVYSDV